jgi:hypothetical protein
MPGSLQIIPTHNTPHFRAAKTGITTYYPLLNFRAAKTGITTYYPLLNYRPAKTGIAPNEIFAQRKQASLHITPF